MAGDAWTVNQPPARDELGKKGPTLADVDAFFAWVAQ
jgi:hypothetical protein